MRSGAPITFGAGAGAYLLLVAALVAVGGERFTWLALWFASLAAVDFLGAATGRASGLAARIGFALPLGLGVLIGTHLLPGGQRIVWLSGSMPSLQREPTRTLVVAIVAAVVIAGAMALLSLVVKAEMTRDRAARDPWRVFLAGPTADARVWSMRRSGALRWLGLRCTLRLWVVSLLKFVVRRVGRVPGMVFGVFSSSLWLCLLVLGTLSAPVGSRLAGPAAGVSGVLTLLPAIVVGSLCVSGVGIGQALWRSLTARTGPLLMAVAGVALLGLSRYGNWWIGGDAPFWAADGYWSLAITLYVGFAVFMIAAVGRAGESIREAHVFPLGLEWCVLLVPLVTCLGAIGSMGAQIWSLAQFVAPLCVLVILFAVLLGAYSPRRPFVGRRARIVWSAVAVTATVTLVTDLLGAGSGSLTWAFASVQIVLLSLAVWVCFGGVAVTGKYLSATRAASLDSIRKDLVFWMPVAATITVSAGVAFRFAHLNPMQVPFEIRYWMFMYAVVVGMAGLVLPVAMAGVLGLQQGIQKRQIEKSYVDGR